MYSHKATDWNILERMKNVLEEHEFMFETLKRVYGLETYAQVKKKLLQLEKNNSFLSCPGSLLFEHTQPQQLAIQRSWDFGIEGLQNAGFIGKNLEFHVSKMRKMGSIKEIEEYVNGVLSNASRSFFR